MVIEGGANVQEPMAPVLVYGSLKRGFVNHHWLEGASFLGEGVMAGLALHDLGPFPMAVPSADGALLHGELYAVDARLLALYRRERWPLVDGRRVWVYLGRPRQVRHVPAIADGCWRGVGKSWLAAKAPPVSP